jgi:hypothetical protein
MLIIMQRPTLPRPHLTQTVAAGEANGAKYDDADEQHDEQHNDLYLEILPPHVATQLPPRLVKLVGLQHTE